MWVDTCKFRCRYLFQGIPMLPFRLVATSRHLVARCRRNASGFSTGLLGKTPAHFVSNRLGLYVARANVLNKNYSTSTTGETSAVGRVWSHKAEDVNAPQNVDLARWLMDDMGHHGDKIALVRSIGSEGLTHLSLDKMATISQTIFSNSFSLMKIFFFFD